MFFRQIYDEKLAEAAYLIGCQKTGEAIVIDAERDIDRYERIAAENGLRIVAAADTTSQTFASTTLGTGASDIVITSSGTHPALLTLGAITRGRGATLFVAESVLSGLPTKSVAPR